MNQRRSYSFLSLTAAVLIALFADAALGQEVQRNVTVRDRARPDFDPLGMRAGAFLIFPSITVDGRYDDNVFATKNNEKDDFIAVIQPRVSVVSNFVRHALGFTVFADIGRYASETDEDFEDFGARANGTLDITRNNRLVGSLGFTRGHEERSSPETVDRVVNTPNKFDNYNATLAFHQDFNRFNFRLSGEAQRRSYINNSQQNRDRNIFAGFLRTGYFISPRINAFVEGGYAVQKRDTATDLLGRSRDSQAWTARVGTEIDITGLVFGEVFVGYSRQTFDDSAFSSTDGFVYGVGVTWNPTGLTSLTLTGRGGFRPTDEAAASTNLQSTIGLRVDHELLRNLLIGGDIGYQRDDFIDANRTDNRIELGADLTYLINRHFSVGAGYSFTTRDSDVSGAEFTRNVFTLSVNARL